jgi:teichuronic acid biosynthesis glycosyltransferase TuaC
VSTAPQALRILHVVPAGSSRSTMAFAHRVVDGLNAVGVENDVFSLRTRTSLSGIIAEARRLRRQVRRGRYHLVHAQYGTVTGFLAATCQPAPTVVTYCGSDLNPVPTIARMRWWVGHLLSQITAARARGVICVSRQLRNRLRFGKAKAVVIPHGIDVEAFKPGDRLTARRRLGLDASARIILFNEGAAPAGKGGKLVREAMDNVKLRLPSAELVVLDGNLPPNSIPDYLRAADCLVCASDWEGSPNIVKEAVAVNLPIVSVDVGDVRELFGSLDSVMVVERTAGAIAAGLVTSLQRPDRPETAGVIRGCLDTVSLARHILGVYEYALSGGIPLDPLASIKPLLNRACHRSDRV